MEGNKILCGQLPLWRYSAGPIPSGSYFMSLKYSIIIIISVAIVIAAASFWWELTCGLHVTTTSKQIVRSENLLYICTFSIYFFRFP